MTDLEAVRRCAEAMGYTKISAHHIGLPLFTSETGIYDPLTDDQQAMALVKRFDVAIRRTSLDQTGGVQQEWAAAIPFNRAVIAPDLNRAIVFAVANRQERK